MWFSPSLPLHCLGGEKHLSFQVRVMLTLKEAHVALAHWLHAFTLIDSTLLLPRGQTSENDSAHRLTCARSVHACWGW